MTLALFPLIIKRWKSSGIYYGDYAQYTQLREYVTEEVFLERMFAIENNVKTNYPQIWIETYLFIFAVALIIAAAAFSIVARAANLSMWYPLIILLIPVIIAFITTRRRNGYYARLSHYYDSLQALLKEFNSQDVYRQLKWSFRRLRDDDTAGVMLLQYPLSTYRINLVIQVHQINTETELAEEGETLPAYGTGMTDVVLDMGPNYQACPEDGVHPVERSTETAIFPPSYENSNVPAAETIEMMPTNPPPAYLSPEPASIPHNNNTIQPR